MWASRTENRPSGNGKMSLIKAVEKHVEKHAQK